MSSPPNNAISPTYPASINLPKKRPSTSASAPGNSKRRKASISSASHPLRQTSFPPSEDLAANSRTPSYSPTVDDSISVVGGRAARSVTGASSVGGGKRGRKPKGKGGNVDARSNARGRSEAADGRGSVADGAGGTRGDDEEVEDEEGEGGEDAVMEDEGKEDEAALKMQREHLAMLVNAFNDDQMERYKTWRRIRLKKETVRKLTNQTLSQSVSPNIILAIGGYTKVFIGELIERAREVQKEWLAASDTLPTGERKLSKHPKAATNDEPMVNQAKTLTPLTHEISAVTVGDETDSEGKQDETRVFSHRELFNAPRFHVEERDCGPLTPDHLREAVRRHKKDREGGSAGFQGLSLHGKEVVASRAGGRRLFR